MDNRNKIKLDSVYETHFGFKDTCTLKVKGWKQVFHANGNQQIEGVTVLRQMD